MKGDHLPSSKGMSVTTMPLKEGTRQNCRNDSSLFSLIPSFQKHIQHRGGGWRPRLAPRGNQTRDAPIAVKTWPKGLLTS